MDSTTDTSSGSTFASGIDAVAKSAAGTQRAAEAAAAAEAAVAERAALRAEGQDMLSRVVKGAHETIDRLADSVGPHVHKIEDSIVTANVKAHARAGQARDVSDEWADSLRDTVRENPLAAVAAAVALGVVIARLTR